MEQASNWLLVFVTLLSGVGVPWIVLMIREQNRLRDAVFTRMERSLQHQDECLDTLRNAVLAKSVTREDFAALRVELNETLSRMRTGISQETNGLHQRIMRLETPYFGHPERQT